MSLSPYALLSRDELKAHVRAGGDSTDVQFDAIINRVTGEIESYLGRWIVCPSGDTTRGSITEYHTMQSDGLGVYSANLRTLEWPIIAMSHVYEDAAVPRTYGTELVAGTDYEVIKPLGIVRRIAGAGAPTYWNVGHRAIKLVYTAGYLTSAAAPEVIRSVALRYAALIWDESKRGAFGVSGASDSIGNFTRFTTAQITDDMRAALASERRPSAWTSGERDS